MTIVQQPLMVKRSAGVPAGSREVGREQPKGDHMEYAKLGQTDLEVSVVTFGCWAMGGEGWGEADDQAAVAAARHALDLGINFYDTADIYGRGHSEELLREAFGARDDVLIATKGGQWWDAPGGFRRTMDPAYLRRAVEYSLRRLGREVIDLYQVHWPPEDGSKIEDGIAALDDLRRQGKIRSIGVSNFSVPQHETALSIAQIHTSQPPLNLFQQQSLEAIIPFCRERNIAVMCYSPMAMGLLTGKFKEDHQFPPGDIRGNPWSGHLFGPEALPRHVRIVNRLNEAAAESGHTVAQLAVNWVLCQPGVTVALVGAKNPKQVDENVGAAGWRLTESDIQRVDEIVRTTE
jgi:aryl-alcohol dehydrogenase-like predicted oxidoreductase